jgi:hypothetical protein
MRCWHPCAGEEALARPRGEVAFGNHLRGHVPRSMLFKNMYARIKKDIPLGDTTTLMVRWMQPCINVNVPRVPT